MKDLYWVIGLLVLQFIVLFYAAYNFNYVNKKHEELKKELSNRLFYRNDIGTWDLPSIIEAMLTYHKLRLKNTRGVKIVKK